MLLHRILEHVNTQNWFAVGIVVVGVVIGIEVANWNDVRNNRAGLVASLDQLARHDRYQDLLSQPSKGVE